MVSDYQSNEIEWARPEGALSYERIKEIIVNQDDNTQIPPWVVTQGNSNPFAAQEAITLDPSDPFDAALIPIVQTNRRKRADYAADGDPFSNFKTTSGMLGIEGFGPAEAALFNVLQKHARLLSLRLNGRMHDTQNETVIDTYLDLAVYAIILYAIVLQEQSPRAN
jgi:hypothetical protein